MLSSVARLSPDASAETHCADVTKGGGLRNLGKFSTDKEEGDCEMTVTYSLQLAHLNPATTFKLLLRWRGSILKVVYREGLVYLLLYGLISFVYRFALEEGGRERFEELVALCREWKTMIPVTFILGFYVHTVFSRWQAFVANLPWIDGLLVALTHLRGRSETCRLYRRTIVRYMLAGQVLSLRAISLQVASRFPSLDHVVRAGLLSRAEAIAIQKTESIAGDTKHWVPAHWALAVAQRAREEGLVTADLFLDRIVAAIDALRGTHGNLLMFDWINIPLVYTQLVSLAVWSHFGVGLLAYQWVDVSGPLFAATESPIDLYFPIFTTLQFLCLVGWLRVAQNMLNPVGEGDDDLELNHIIDRNLTLGLLVAEDLEGRSAPVLKPDSLGMDRAHRDLPYTKASVRFVSKGFDNSAAGLNLDPVHGVLSRSPSQISQASAPSKLPKRSLAALPERFWRKVSRRKPSSLSVAAVILDAPTAVASDGAPKVAVEHRGTREESKEQPWTTRELPRRLSTLPEGNGSPEEDLTEEELYQQIQGQNNESQENI